MQEIKTKSFFEVSLEDVTRLILIRHGRTAANDQGRMTGLSDIPLDAMGMKQAELVAAKVASYEPSVIYSSPLARARQTAEAIAARVGLEIVNDKDLVEYDFGELSDMTLGELEQKNPILFEQVNAWISMGPELTMKRPEIKGIETAKNLADRIGRFTALVTEKHPGSVVVAVAHGALIRSMLTVWAGGSLTNRMAFRSNNASISVIDFYNGVPAIRQFNDICHLDTKLSYGRPVVF